MRISRLYLKIFLSFMLVLIISELVVFSLLRLSWSQNPRINHMEKQILTVKNLAELELGSKHVSAEYEKKVLTPLMETLGKSLQANVWITDPYGKVVASSSKTIPDMSDYTEGDSVKSKAGIFVYKKRNGGMKSVYGVYTAQLPKGYPFTYHVHHSFPKFNEEIWFLRAQIVLTILAALLLIPVARRMIRPIRNMTITAAKMGRGDLKQRVEINGKDEIAELAKAFNHMAEGLEKMVKSNRELSANISHELRSPLTRMRISLEMLKERINDSRTSGCETFISSMMAEITHMDELIGRIIDFSKLDIHKPPSMKDISDLKGLIEDLLKQYAHSASRKQITVESRLHEIKLHHSNRNGLRIILDNILGNSFKYTEPDGKISIQLNSDNENVIIEVVNTHAPLDEADLEEIFNPFYRLKGQEIPGSGLGLASAQKIVQIHEGRIWAENSSEGFKITVILPMQNSD